LKCSRTNGDKAEVKKKKKKKSKGKKRKRGICGIVKILINTRKSGGLLHSK
jgi:hypothetical protein